LATATGPGGLAVLPQTNARPGGLVAKISSDRFRLLQIASDWFRLVSLLFITFHYFSLLFITFHLSHYQPVQIMIGAHVGAAVL
jgi:hypothetical protein